MCAFFVGTNIAAAVASIEGTDGMTLDRRGFLTGSGAVAALAALPRRAAAQERFIKEPGPWRKFELTTRLDIAKPEGRVQAWVPVPSVEDADWSKPAGSTWKTNAKVAELKAAGPTKAVFVHLQWAEGEPAPYAEIASDISTRDRSTDFSRPRKITALTDEERATYTAPMQKIAGDEGVRQLSASITENAKTDLGKAKAIYEWLAGSRQCSGETTASVLDGGLTSLNMLYVRLARAAGLPARVIYGLRIAPSQFGYASLGVASTLVTKAQHSRAEVWLEDYGWTPVDPADVCRVIREEPLAEAPSADVKVVSARLTLFGAWEGNWLAYNMASNVMLPGFDPLEGERVKKGRPRSVANLMYPLAETAAGLRDGRAPDSFRYVITAKELPA
jgi:transglutaminase-like putative cysteine protease